MIAYPDIDPVLFRLGPLAIRWYGVMYLAGFTAGYFIIRARLAKTAPSVTRDQVESLVLWLIVGLIVGARLGEIVFYQWPDWDRYLKNPLAIVAVWQGGMSFHGGLIGTTIAGLIYLKRRKIPILPVVDACFLAAPLGMAAGRWGNFINGELYGRVSSLPWAMVFPGGGPLSRHPSQLYELILEGPILLALLWWRRDKVRPGGLAALFLISYGSFRFLVEFVREPDAHLGFILAGLTTGQLLCLGQAAAGVILWRYLAGRKR